MSATNRGKKYTTHKQKMVRITISMNQSVIDMIDQAAAEDFTTRSDMIRQAVLWYLRPQGRDLAHVDPSEILKVLQHQKALAASRKALKEMGPYKEDS
jgi:metal-responsive CopG/Arc/MetJ family transcriptional regulator